MEPVPSAQSLLLLNEADLQNPKLPEIWAKLKSIPFSEASSHIRKSWGLITNNLTPHEADQFSIEFKKFGILVKICPTSILPNLPPAAIVKSLFFSTNDLGVRLQKEEALHPWRDLIGLFSFALNETVVKTTKVTEGPSAGEQIAKAGIMLATGLPIPIGKKKTVVKTEKKNELVFLLDLLFENPIRRFRVDGQHLDYSILGPKKEMAAQVNFRILFDDLRSRSPKAFLNKGSRVLTAHQPISTMGYDSLHDVDREMVWYLASH